MVIRVLQFLISEAESLLRQAAQYRHEMDALPSTSDIESLRRLYVQMILDLLDRSRRLSTAVTTLAPCD